MGLRLLARTGLLGPAFRLWERRLARSSAAGAGEPGTGPPDDLPLPPAELMVLVAGHAKQSSFLRRGKAAADVIEEAARRRARGIADMEAILDFGCGSGRVARWWSALDGVDVHGCDVNPRLVAWVDENLPFVTARATPLEPPTPYPDAAFDLVYALSVFTHLPAELQRPWAAELRRIMKPGGLLIITTHGTAYLDRLTREEVARFEAGEVVVHFEQLAGANLCSAFHPRQYLSDILLPDFELLEFAPAGSGGSGRQDLVVARRAG
jgi:SAM-dependent methyltransferase